MTFRYILNKLVGFNYNNDGSSKEYIYQRNIQGDIIGIFDDSGNFVGGYAYDGYGNHIITKDENGIASLNPFRYRGYFFDDETQLYYLNSRYYDPEIGRFISPDTLSILDETRGQINGLNLYMYCKDNPIMYYDPSGKLAGLIIGLLVGSFVIGAGASAISQGLTYGWDKINLWQVGIDGLFAVASTALAMTGIGALVSAGIGAVAGWSQYAIGSVLHGEELTLLGSLTAVGLGAIGGAISGAGARNGANIASSMKLTGKGASAIKAITTASNRYLTGEISMKGLQATTRLWGNVALNAVQDAIAPTIRNLMITSALKIAIWTVASIAIANVLSRVYIRMEEIWGQMRL